MNIMNDLADRHVDGMEFPCKTNLHTTETPQSMFFTQARKELVCKYSDKLSPVNKSNN